MTIAGRHIGHLPIRVRGTFGGSVAYADPSAEWCLLCTMLDARIGIVSARGHRFVAAEDFFQTPLGTPFAPANFFETGSSFQTALEADELVDEVRLPLLGPSAGVGFAELSRRENDSAFVSAAAAIVLDGEKVTQAFLGVGGRGIGPVSASTAEAALVDHRLGPEQIADAARTAAAAVEPVSDIHGSPEYRRGLVEALVRRAIEQAADQAARAAT